MGPIRKKCAMVFQHSTLFDSMTCAENVALPLRKHKNLSLKDALLEARRRLELVHMQEFGDRYPPELGDGMRKRVAMAASLIHRPQLFLMDEPFEGVDAVGARLMKDILLDQVRRGATIFLTSHVLEVVERLCDRVAIIQQGRLVMEGDMAELRSGTETLEDIFVRVVGAARAGESASAAKACDRVTISAI